MKKGQIKKCVSLNTLVILTILIMFFVAGCTQNNEAHPTTRLCLVQYIDSPMSDDTKQGVIEGLHASGLTEGKDYSLKIFNAQGDIGTLNATMDMVKNGGYTLLFVSSTPTLQAALHKIRDIPLVFTTVADPVAAGAGKSFNDHFSNVTGISTLGDYEGFVKVLSRMTPKTKILGTLFSPGEINSVINKEQLERYAAKYDMTVVSIPVYTTADVGTAAQALLGKDIDAVCQIVCNLTDATFPAIIKEAQKNMIPVFGFTQRQIQQGAVAVVARDYVQAGIDAAKLAVRILQGENPAAIPFAMVSTSNLIINKRAAANYGIHLQEDLLKEATQVIDN